MAPAQAPGGRLEATISPGAAPLLLLLQAGPTARDGRWQPLRAGGARMPASLYQAWQSLARPETPVLRSSARPSLPQSACGHACCHASLRIPALPGTRLPAWLPDRHFGRRPGRRRDHLAASRADGQFGHDVEHGLAGGSGGSSGGIGCKGAGGAECRSTGISTTVISQSWAGGSRSGSGWRTGIPARTSSAGRTASGETAAGGTEHGLDGSSILTLTHAETPEARRRREMIGNEARSRCDQAARDRTRVRHTCWCCSDVLFNDTAGFYHCPKCDVQERQTYERRPDRC